MRWAWPVLVVSALVIGLAPVLAKLSVQHGAIGPMAAAFWRLALAVPLLVVLAIVLKRPSGQPSIPAWRSVGLLAIPGLFFAGDLATWHWSFEFTSVANATLITNLSTILLSLAGWLFLGERPGRVFPVALALALGGAALLAYSTTGRPAHEGFSVFGDALAGGTAVFYAGYLLSVKLLRVRFGAWSIMAGASVMGSLAVGLGAWLHGERFLPVNHETWIILALLALVVHTGGQGGIAIALRHLPASGASIVLLLQPVATAILGWLILGQVLVPLQYAGGCLVLAGVALAILNPSRSGKTTPN